MKRTLALLLVVVLVAALFVGCSPVGKYHVKSIDGDKPEVFIEDYLEDLYKDKYERYYDDFDEFLKAVKIDEDDWADPAELELKKDGKFELEINVTGTTVKGKWEKDGNKIKFKPKDGKNFKADVKGGKIIIDGDDLGFDGIDGDIVFGK